MSCSNWGAAWNDILNLLIASIADVSAGKVTLASKIAATVEHISVWYNFGGLTATTVKPEKVVKTEKDHGADSDSHPACPALLSTMNMDGLYNFRSGTSRVYQQSGQAVCLDDAIEATPLATNPSFKVCILQQWLQHEIYRYVFVEAYSSMHAEKIEVDLSHPQCNITANIVPADLRLMFVGGVTLSHGRDCLKVANMFGLDWFVNGTHARSIASECPVLAWMLPHVDANKANMQFDSVIIKRTLKAGFFVDLTEDLDVEISIPSLVPSKEIVGKEEVLLSRPCSETADKKRPRGEAGAEVSKAFGPSAALTLLQAAMKRTGDTTEKKKDATMRKTGKHLLT